MKPKEFYEQNYAPYKDTARRVYDRLFFKKSNEILLSFPSYIKIEDSKVLDVGCGAGECLVTFAWHGAEVTGITPRQVEVDTAKTWLKDSKMEGTVIKGTGEDLSFIMDNSFDIILLIQTIEHVQDINKVISEIYRVLKPNGFLRITGPNNLQPYEGHYKTLWLPFCPKWIAKKYVKWILNKDPLILDNINYMTRHGMMKRLNQHGFKHISNFNSNKFYSSIDELYQK